MPFVVYVLAAAVFAQGTSEFMLSGLLPRIATDLGVSLGAAGLLTSLFAAGMVLGAPTMAMVASRLPVGIAVTAFLGLFGAVHVIGATTTDFEVLLATRVFAAIANAGFLAIVLAALPRWVGPALVGRATAVVVSGVTVACIVGVPAGTLLGQLWGWRSAFWAVAAVSALLLVPVWALVPRGGDESAAPRTAVRRGAVVADRRVVRAGVIAILVNAATFAAFTYLGAITADIGVDPYWVPVVLALFGVGSFAGVTVAGRYSDRYRDRIVIGGTGALVAVWAVTALTAHTLIGLTVMAAVAGALAFGVGSTLIATIVGTAAPAAPRIAGALATTAFNLGAVLGPVAAGMLVDATRRPVAALWCGALLVAIAASVLVLGRRDTAAEVSTAPR
ncbi:Cmx/CmrA family chloramphenicol efflux MFS transporter [Nocardia otitidiscaviarum]|uniref:Cmx/CmrA family chloramphenicol efflux MFS transporter n=1 Tax=Nocardia otitidiscaviarum TaxID=1823 RepID=UPI00189494D6|nr:Cmx/CmrA family chloramphenicol efflux MFS transporter [Nocardia otitidiscaviarum]MBF6179998.1 MFS transporter [Nocardia otitidiscaviarum]